jgi:shikimate dehydrogenase
MIPPTLSGATRLVPILAHPVDHVRAPRTYNPAFAEAGLDWCLVPMGVHPDDLAATLAQLARVSNLQGVNLTIPHKAHGFRLCRWLTREAARVRMVNTLRIEPDGHWAGTNSDGAGFIGAAREHGLLDATRPVVIVGSGGAGSAIAFALAAEGVR